MYKVQIITASTSKGLADKAAAAFNKLVTSPVVSNITIQYAVAVLSPEKLVQSLTVPTVIPANVEYSCMIAYSVVEYKQTPETITNH